jgi:predicted DNA-binding protein
MMAARALTLTVHIWSCMVSVSALCLTFGAWLDWIVMARKKISTTVYITAEQNERLKLLHEKTKVPVAEYIRQGIDLVLERENDRLPGQLTLDSIRK